eukprot:89066-Amphidinium_carterae.1
MILDVEAFVSPLMVPHMPSNPRVLIVNLNLPTSETDDVVENVISDLEAVVRPLLPSDALSMLRIVS